MLYPGAFLHLKQNSHRVVSVGMVVVIVEHLAIILMLVEKLSKSEICNNAWK
jgi:hypothetical protein